MRCGIGRATANPDARIRPAASGGAAGPSAAGTSGHVARPSSSSMRCRRSSISSLRCVLVARFSAASSRFRPTCACSCWCSLWMLGQSGHLALRRLDVSLHAAELTGGLAQLGQTLLALRQPHPRGVPARLPACARRPRARAPAAETFVAVRWRSPARRGPRPAPAARCSTSAARSITAWACACSERRSSSVDPMRVCSCAQALQASLDLLDLLLRCFELRHTTSRQAWSALRAPSPACQTRRARHADDRPRPGTPVGAQSRAPNPRRVGVRRPVAPRVS